LGNALTNQNYLDDWLTVHHSITFYHQLDTQTSCLFKCLVHRLRKNFLNRCTGQSPAESDDTRDCIYTITT